MVRYPDGDIKYLDGSERISLKLPTLLLTHIFSLMLTKNNTPSEERPPTSQIQHPPGNGQHAFSPFCISSSFHTDKNMKCDQSAFPPSSCHEYFIEQYTCLDKE